MELEFCYIVSVFPTDMMWNILFTLEYLPYLLQYLRKRAYLAALEYQVLPTPKLTRLHEKVSGSNIKAFHSQHDWQSTLWTIYPSVLKQFLSLGSNSCEIRHLVWFIHLTKFNQHVSRLWACGHTYFLHHSTSLNTQRNCRHRDPSEAILAAM